jgi:hypothetical protein
MLREVAFEPVEIDVQLEIAELAGRLVWAKRWFGQRHGVDRRSWRALG